MTLQAIDFLKIHNEYNCNIQIGGSDQWGNLTAGLDLIRKIKGVDEKVECMTAHLITRSDGKKFGKSEDGALFLDESLTSPYKLYQFFYNQSDEDAVKYIKVFTFLEKEEIEKIEKEHINNPGKRIAQKVLAYEVTKIVHGENKAKEALNISEALFSNNFSSLSESALAELFKNYLINLDIKNLSLEEILIKIGASSSKRESREFIKNGAVLVNGNKVFDNLKVFSSNDLMFNKYLLIKRGKKNYYLINTTL